MKIIEVETKRKDSLFGCWYGEDYRDTCVIVTNGTGGNIFENKFLRIMGDELEKSKISYIYAHNSGAFQMIHTPTLSGKNKGLTFEMFDDCAEDLQAFVDFAKQQGYKKIVLGGHSYGCNKVVYYLHKTNCKNVDKFVLISPTDTEMHTEGEIASIKKMDKLARKLVKKGGSQEIMPILFDNYNFFTAGSYLDFMENEHHHNLPVYHDKANFAQLKSIKICGLFVMGQNDTFAKRDAQNHLKVIYENCGNKKNVVKVIPDAGHTFRGKELELSEIVKEFVK